VIAHAGSSPQPVPVRDKADFLGRDRHARRALESGLSISSNKPALVAYLRKVLARAAEGSFDLEPCRRQLAPFFSGEALYDRVFAGL
jgi:hypothetical protein